MTATIANDTLKIMDIYLRPTAYIDSNHQEVKRKAQELIEGSTGFSEKAIKLFYFVRDGIRYNPYAPRSAPVHFHASATLSRGEGFCIQKAVLLAALNRAVGIPSRLGFAIIKNHQMPEKMASMLITDEIPDHGYTEILTGKKWLKVTPAFDLAMCRERGIIPVEFDGKHDALFHPWTVDGQPHMEYITYKGHFEDLPFDQIMEWTAPSLTGEARQFLLGIYD